MEPGALIAFSGGDCPPRGGWERVNTTEGEPMFLAVGLLTDVERSPFRPETGKPVLQLRELPRRATRSGSGRRRRTNGGRTWTPGAIGRVRRW
jgi:hypothetical protein